LNVDIKEAAADAIALLSSENPKIVLLSGPASGEDQMYFRHAPIEKLSHSTVPEALRNVGCTNVAVVDITKDRQWTYTVATADLVIINLHGSPGEDGVIQGGLEAMGCRYLGAGVECSVVALNKYLAKLVAESLSIRTPQWTLIDDGIVVAGKGERPEQRAVICKPIRGGSSIGIEMMARDTAWPATGRWLCDEFIQGTDATVTILEVRGQPIALPAISLRHNELYYTETAKFAKQWDCGVLPDRPAALTSVFRECEEIALKYHRAIGARHISRSDFVLSPVGESWFLETNTLPGMSRVSNAAECAYAAGLTYEEFVALLVGAGLSS